MRLAPVALLLCGLCAAQRGRDMPAGIILSSAGGRVRPAGDAGTLAAQPGMLLYAGDTVLSDAGRVRFAFCPDRKTRELTGGAEAKLEANAVVVRQGPPAVVEPLPFCSLPGVARVAENSADQYQTRAVPISLEGTFQSRLLQLAREQREKLLEELAPAAQALSRNPRDRMAQLERAVVLQKYGMTADAAAEYRSLQSAWEGAVWTRGVVVPPEPPPRAALTGGKTYALIVGISQYENRSVPPLHYADQDAEMFAAFLRKDRGGRLPDDQLLLLTNGQATSEAIRRGIGSFLAERAGPNDTVILFIAGHGMAASTGRDPRTGELRDQEGFILTYKSDPEDLVDSALPMQEIRDVMVRHLARVGRVLVYVDVCRSGNIGVITEKNAITAFIHASLRDNQGKLSTLMASKPLEYAFEAKEFGGGHGAFTYFLLSGLNGEADQNHDRVVTSGELIRFVEQQVSEATWDEQHPDKLNFLLDRTELASLDKEGIDVGGFQKLPEKVARGGRRGVRSGGAQALTASDSAQPSSPGESAESLFAQALAKNHVLPERPDSAFFQLERLRQDPGYPRERVPALEDQLRVRLENLGQDILIRYLVGDQLRTPQTRGDFVACANYFRAALRIAPVAILDESRASFCEGRALIFEKQYDRAVELLEKAVRLNPARPYAYNALGIAYLEQASKDRAFFTRAEQALLDANRRAPYWSYPLHNLALLYTEMGDYDKAIRAYRQAMLLSPRYSYIPYNLAVLDQRLNRGEDALAMYAKAVELAQDSCGGSRASACAERATPFNGLGTLYASRGRAGKAAAYYQKALDDDPKMLAARHNLALLWAGKAATAPKAEAVWRANLAEDPHYLPSLLSLCEYLARSGQTAEAISRYRDLLALEPAYNAARFALIRLLLKSARVEEALAQTEQGLRLKPDDAGLLEFDGDALKRTGRREEAVAAYTKALGLGVNSATRKRLRKAVKN